ncbi:MAG TPA: proline/glycine betaine ABC transporter permease [Methanomassiliicoccales archaeon]|nr:proline/glycine betaine ABC transporter permease [Methanomassiliicoccales archaeon]
MMVEKIPWGEWAEGAVDVIKDNLDPLLDAIYSVLNWMANTTQDVLMTVPDLWMILIISVFSLLVTRKIIMSGLIAVALLVIWNMGLWELSMLTLTLVVVAAIISLLVGIPLGILSAKSNFLNKGMKVVLDFMQTMPSFVYLIPVVILFRLGNVPGIIATVIFALPPVVRFTDLGIREVPKELKEVSESFGTNWLQKLTKVELPMAKPTIMAGINQCIMLSLSMVVIASMIGVAGLGRDVLMAIQRVDVAMGFEAGLAVVLLAIILDRITQSIGSNRS